MAAGIARAVNIPVSVSRRQNEAYAAQMNESRAAQMNSAAAQQRARDSVRPSAQSNTIDTSMKNARFTGIKRRDDGTVEIPVFKMYGPDGKPRVYYSGSKAERSERPEPMQNDNTARGENAIRGENAAMIYGPAVGHGGNTPSITAPTAKTGGVEGASAKANINNKGECQTCAARRYQDGSDDSGVSFQTPTHISPTASVAAVAGHENEHRVREAQDAKQSDQRIVSSNIRIHMAQCPECKKMYAAGGVTETTKAPKNNEEENPLLEGVGMFLDEAV